MTTPEWMKKYKEIGQKGEEEVTGGHTDGDDDNKQEKEEIKRKPKITSSDSVSNSVSMFETSLRQMSGKLHSTDPFVSSRGDTSSKIGKSANATSSTKEDVAAAENSPSKAPPQPSSLPSSDDSTIACSTKGQKWRDRLTANKQKKKQQATDPELSLPLTIEDDDNTNENIVDQTAMPATEKSDVASTGNEEDRVDKNNNIDKEEGSDNYDTDDDAVQEDDDIVREFSDSSNSNEESNNDDAIRKADNVVCEFSDSSNSNEESDNDDAICKADDIVREFSDSSNSSKESNNDDVIRKADDIVSEFSDSSNSNEESDDDIVREFSDSSNSNKESNNDDVIRRADNIVREFSDSSNSNKESDNSDAIRKDDEIVRDYSDSSNSNKESDDDNAIRKDDEIVREFSNSSNSNKESDDAIRENDEIVREFSNNSNSNKESDDDNAIHKDDDIVREFSDSSNSNKESNDDNAIREDDEIVREFSDSSNSNKESDDDNAIRENDKIVREFSDSSNSNKESDDDDGIREADDIVREFSDSSNRNKESDDDDGIREADDIVRDFSENIGNSREDIDNAVEINDIVHDVGALAMSASNNIINDDDEDDDEDVDVLMHSLNDSDDDIPLDNLFSTAASLDIRLETGQSVSTSLQRRRSYEDDIEITAASSNLVIDSKEEEEEVEDNNHLHVPTGVAAVITSSSRSRTVLYSNDDDDDDDDDDDIIDPEEGQNIASIPMAPLTTQGILLLPYSTGKRKKNSDGVSITSDDITVWGGISKEDRAALIPNTGRISMLPYTVVKSALPTTSPKKNPYKKYLCLCILIVLILIIIIASSVSFYMQRNNNNLNNNSLPISASPSSPSFSPIALPKAPSNAPVTPSTVAPSNDPVIPPTSAPVVLVAPPTLESIESPTPAPVEPPTPALVSSSTGPTEGLLVDFNQTVVFAGQGNGDRFGSVISMTTDGNFMTVLSNSPMNPVQAFQQMRESPRNWFPILTFPVSNMSLSFGADIDTATTPDGSLVVAISSRTQVEVYKLIDGAWIELGQPLQWSSPSVSYTAMALSTDASTLAAGYVNDDGDVISVNVYTYDAESLTWIPLGGDPLQENARTRAIDFREGIILSISLALSGNGRVLTIEEWAVADIQVVIQNFEWNDVGEINKWSLMGSHLPILFGPTSIALSNDGLRVAIVANTPGKGGIYDWDDKNDEWNLLGKRYDDDNNIDYFLPGGSSVALARNGSRIIIGNASMNKALIYDYSTGTDTWLLTTSFSGSDSSSYGAAVTMDETGSTIGIGAPTVNKRSGNNLGQVILYEAY